MIWSAEFLLDNVFVALDDPDINKHPSATALQTNFTQFLASFLASVGSPEQEKLLVRILQKICTLSPNGLQFTLKSLVSLFQLDNGLPKFVKEPSLEALRGVAASQHIQTSHQYLQVTKALLEGLIALCDPSFVQFDSLGRFLEIVPVRFFTIDSNDSFRLPLARWLDSATQHKEWLKTKLESALKLNNSNELQPLDNIRRLGRMFTLLDNHNKIEVVSRIVSKLDKGPALELFCEVLGEDHSLQLEIGALLTVDPLVGMLIAVIAQAKDFITAEAEIEMRAQFLQMVIALFEKLRVAKPQLVQALQIPLDDLRHTAQQLLQRDAGEEIDWTSRLIRLWATCCSPSIGMFAQRIQLRSLDSQHLQDMLLTLLPSTSPNSSHFSTNQLREYEKTRWECLAVVLQFLEKENQPLRASVKDVLFSNCLRTLGKASDFSVLLAVCRSLYLILFPAKGKQASIFTIGADTDSIVQLLNAIWEAFVDCKRKSSDYILTVCQICFHPGTALSPKFNNYCQT
jgi:hypothetical protein